jgi:hypothetical protein
VGSTRHRKKTPHRNPSRPPPFLPDSFLPPPFPFSSPHRPQTCSVGGYRPHSPFGLWRFSFSCCFFSLFWQVNPLEKSVGDEWSSRVCRRRRSWLSFHTLVLIHEFILKTKIRTNLPLSKVAIYIYIYYNVLSFSQ